jgi:cytidylate kinase
MKIDWNKLVITVEGELCAEQEALGAALANVLHMPCYRGEILETANRISGISWKLLKRYEEKPVRSAYDLTASGENDLHMPPARDFLTAQIAACRELAEEGPCILVDHHANAAISDRADHLSVFVHVDRDLRLLEFARRHGLSPQEAKPRFAREDRVRSRYFRSVFPGWGKAGSYDITLKAGGIIPEELTNHVIRYLEAVTRERLVHPTPARERSA